MTKSVVPILRHRYAYLVLFVALFLFIYYYKESHRKLILKILQPSDGKTVNYGTVCLQPLKIELTKCLMKSFNNPSTVWSSLTYTINKCCYVLQKTLKTIKLENKDDEKYVIMPEHDPSNCIVLTVGVGNDIEAEKILRSLNPKCKFYGVDPTYESGSVYTQIGRFIQTAVSDKDGAIESNILSATAYVKKKVESTNFFSILNLTNSNVVDYLFFDAEGAEYSIIPLLNRNKLKNFHICQISIELHGLKAYNITETRFADYFFDFLQNTNYVPVFATFKTFHRMFWIDFQSPHCVNKYLPNYCTKNQDWFQIEQFTAMENV